MLQMLRLKLGSMFEGTGSLETKTRYSTHLNRSEQMLDLRKHASLAYVPEVGKGKELESFPLLSRHSLVFHPNMQCRVPGMNPPYADHQLA